MARKDFDFYPTPTRLAESALRLLPPRFEPNTILDPGAGAGSWGQAARGQFKNAVLDGVEIQSELPPVQGYDAWHHSDYLLWNAQRQYDLVIGNPPYGKLALPFVLKALSELRHGGYAVFVVRLAFLAGQDRSRKLYSMHPPYEVYVISQRPSFTGDGGTEKGGEYAALIFRKGYTGTPRMKWLSWR